MMISLVLIFGSDSLMRSSAPMWFWDESTMSTLHKILFSNVISIITNSRGLRASHILNSDYIRFQPYFV